jgi:hypothetical protein
MSSAPAASALASACGKERGRTSVRSLSAMFFMARATEPILPGWLGIDEDDANESGHALLF